MPISYPEWSLAHRQLLTYFTGRPRPVYPDLTYHWTYHHWRAALGESWREAVGRFLEAGLLVHCCVPEQLIWGFTLAQLKDLLRERGLKLSGTKVEVADRLYRADEAGMERTGAVALQKAGTMNMNVLCVAHPTHAAAIREAGAECILVKCSEAGLRLVAEYTAIERQMSQTALDALRDRDFDLAISTLLSFRDKLGFPPLPMGELSPESVRDRIRLAFAAKPKILSGINEGAMGCLRFAAAASSLSGLCRGIKEGECFAPDADLIRGLKTGLNMENETALRMVVGHVNFQSGKENWKQLGVKRVRLCGVHDPDPTRGSCQACKELDGREWPIEGVPDLPYQHCTSRLGCRCMSIPVSRPA